MTEWTEDQIEAGARALFGDTWDQKATAGNKRYCREKVRDILAAVFARGDGESASKEKGE